MTLKSFAPKKVRDRAEACGLSRGNACRGSQGVQPWLYHVSRVRNDKWHHRYASRCLCTNRRASKRKDRAAGAAFGRRAVVISSDPRIRSVGHRQRGRYLLSTNCTHLNEQAAERLIRAGLGQIALSFDGMTKETFESIRINARFEKVKRNIALGFYRSYLERMLVESCASRC